MPVSNCTTTLCCASFVVHRRFVICDMCIWRCGDVDVCMSRCVCIDVFMR